MYSLLENTFELLLEKFLNYKHASKIEYSHIYVHNAVIHSTFKLDA